MFQRATATERLYLVKGGKERSQTKGVSNMNMSQLGFAESSVSNAVTLLVSAWFLVAAGAILSDPASPYTQRPVAQVAAAEAAPQVVVAETIVVEAKRLKA